MGERGKKWQADVLSVLRQRGGPLTAYEVLGELRHSHPNISPPTIYRALSALRERGEILRLESLNAFIACQHRGTQHGAILSICDECGVVEESVAPDVLAELSKVAGRSGFSALRHVVELHGQCAACHRGGTTA
ncbi:MAG: Fur family transcriptional regulator [Pseudomonadota bacterium]